MYVMECIKSHCSRSLLTLYVMECIKRRDRGTPRPNLRPKLTPQP